MAFSHWWRAASGQAHDQHVILHIHCDLGYDSVMKLVPNKYSASHVSAVCMQHKVMLGHKLMLG